MTKRKTTVTSTMHLLMMQYGTQAHLKLDEIADSLGYSIKTAQRKANSHELPFNVFKMLDSNKAPYLVDIRDLAMYFDERRSAANDEWLKT